MNSQDFLMLNLVGAGAFVLWYLFSRANVRRPTQLNMHAKDTAPPVLPPEAIVASESTIPVQRASGGVSAAAAGLRAQRQEATKTLNVIFNYNGHSWDAYEVLGVPAGASLPMVTEAYQKAILQSKKESMEFLQTAYSAILNTKG